MGIKRFIHKIVWGLAGFMLVASGCQTSTGLKSAGLDNTGFMTLWDTYTHCRATSDLNDASTDTKNLEDAARSRYGHDGFVLPLPTKLEHLVANPTNRFAVDVRAMAAACSLHAGQLAVDRGRLDLARELFASVVSLHPHDDSSYYLSQAKTFLSELERGVDVSLKTP